MFNLEFSMKRESNWVEFGYPTLIWLQDYLNLENSFFKGNYLLSKASSIAPNMPSCFLKRQIGLAKVFHKSSSPPSKGFLDLTPHKFKSITQKSEQKYFIFLLWFLLLLSHIHLLQFLSCSNLLQEPWPNHKDCFSFHEYVTTFVRFFYKQMFCLFYSTLHRLAWERERGWISKSFPWQFALVLSILPCSDK